MKVSQYMTRPVITITPDIPFRRAFDLMHSHGFHHLPLVENDRVVGVVARTDLLLAAANFGSAEVPVAEIASNTPVCVTENAQLKYAIQVLLKHRIGCLPVLNTRKQLVGIITETDIFKITAGMLNVRPVAKKAITKGAKKATSKTAKKTVKKVTKKAA
jgi:acetoin utilization protein AcuB